MCIKQIRSNNVFIIKWKSCTLLYEVLSGNCYGNLCILSASFIVNMMVNCALYMLSMF